VKLAFSAENLARDVQGIARRYVEHYGYKQGLHLFGRAIGEGDRRARALYAGEARRIEAHEYLLAREADVELKRLIMAQSAERARQLRRELEGYSDAASFVGDGACVRADRARA